MIRNLNEIVHSLYIWLLVTSFFLLARTVAVRSSICYQEWSCLLKTKLLETTGTYVCPFPRIFVLLVNSRIFLNKFSRIYRVSEHTLIGTIFFRQIRHFFQLFKILDSAGISNSGRFVHADSPKAKFLVPDWGR